MRNKFDYDFKWWQSPNINTTIDMSRAWKDEVIEDKNNKWGGGNVNPKMKLTKEELRMNVIGQNGNDGLHYEGMDMTDITAREITDRVCVKFSGIEDAGRKIEIDYEKVKTPNYYVGEVFGYEARNIIEDFDLSYNIGTCVSYLLRAKRKHDSQIECIAKAINHLEFELERLKRNEKTNL